MLRVVSILHRNVFQSKVYSPILCFNWFNIDSITRRHSLCQFCRYFFFCDFNTFTAALILLSLLYPHSHIHQYFTIFNWYTLLLIYCRKDAKNVMVKKNGDATKFKIRCTKYLYTFTSSDKSMADKLNASLPATLTRI